MTEKPRYTLISSDTHAGANHATYREYLDPKFHDDFDAWRGKYKNPWKDLRDTDLRVRNWDNDRRDADQHADGVVGEVVFPNTVPPFYPGLRAVRGSAQARGLRAPARRDCRRTTAGSSTSARPGRARAPASGRSSSTTSTTRSKTRRGSRSTVCAAACCCPTIAPDVKWVKPLYDPYYDPLWAACQDLDIPVTLHGGTGSPDYGKYASTPMIMISEVGFYSFRPFVHMLLSGVFERFPRMKFVITEAGGRGVPAHARSSSTRTSPTSARARSAS